MRPVDKFNPGQWLVENKLTNQSKLYEIKVGNPNLSDDMKEYLLKMIHWFNDGNDNEYPVGKEMEYRIEEINFDDHEFWGPEIKEKFMITRDFLERNGPVTLNDRIDYTYSADGEDIVMNWVEPDWDELNSK